MHPAAVLETIDTEIAYREAQVSRFRGRDRTVDAAHGPIPYDAQLISALNEDLDRFGRDSTDAWIAWLRTMKAEWSDRLADTKETLAISRAREVNGM